VNKLSREDVIAAYQLLLGRPPENEAMIVTRMKGSAAALIESLTASLEYVTRPKDTPFLYYRAVFDPGQLILEHENPSRSLKPGHLVNFFGVAMNLAFAPEIFAGQSARVEGPPIPANWHADMAEFGAAFRAVDFARETFTMVELGCGWGCWMNNTGVAAKRRGLRVHLIGVEADPGHLKFAREALTTNGFMPSEYTLLGCAAAAETGAAFFPKQDQTGSDWSLEPLMNLPNWRQAEARKSGDYDEIPTKSLADIIGDRPRIDLVHIDIQGGELELVRKSIELLRSKVAYLVIGTHSRSIDSALMSELTEAGWQLEIERPSLLRIENGHPELYVDGIQGWKNPRFDNLRK